MTTYCTTKMTYCSSQCTFKHLWTILLTLNVDNFLWPLLLHITKKKLLKNNLHLNQVWIEVGLMANFRRQRSGQVWQQRRQEQHGREGENRRQFLLCWAFSSVLMQNTGMCTQADSLINRLPSLIALQLLFFMCFLPWYADKWQKNKTVKSKKTTAI